MTVFQFVWEPIRPDRTSDPRGDCSDLPHIIVRSPSWLVDITAVGMQFIQSGQFVKYEPESCHSQPTREQHHQVFIITICSFYLKSSDSTFPTISPCRELSTLCTGCRLDSICEESFTAFHFTHLHPNTWICKMYFSKWPTAETISRPSQSLTLIPKTNNHT